MRTLRNSSLCILHFTLLCSECAAGQRILGANDFSYYRWNGQEGTFMMRTVSVTTNLAVRQRFWKGVATDKVPVIYQLTFPKVPGWIQKLPKTPAEAVAAIDALFAPGEGVEPCPEKLFAVTPCEENVTWDGQTEVQDAIIRHLNGRYGVKVYQWLTEPYKPILDFPADGWVFDAYHVQDPQKFYAHVESFILTGVPVVPCIWAAGHSSKYHLDKTWDELTRFTVERMDICRALDLPVMVFAVAGKMGSVGLWFRDADDPGERYYRETIKRYLAAVPTMPKASWKPATKRWRASVMADGSAAARVNLKSFELVHETEFDDVRAWKLGKDGLSLVRERGRLIWRLDAPSRIRKGRFSLRHSQGANGTFCGRPLSPSGLTEVEATDFHSRLVVLEAQSPLTLYELTLSGEGEYAVESIDLKPESPEQGAAYRRKVRFDASEGELHPEAGRVVRRRIIRRLPLPGCAGKITLLADMLAERAHGGSATISVFPSLDGKAPIATVKADSSKRFQKPTIDIDVAAGTDDMYVAFDMVAASGFKAKQLAVKLYYCDFTFQPSKPLTTSH